MEHGRLAREHLLVQQHYQRSQVMDDAAAGEPARAQCYDAVPPEACYGAVMWAKKVGVRQRPEWYQGLAETAEFWEFQALLHQTGHTSCGPPCQAAPSPRQCETPTAGQCFEAVSLAMEVVKLEPQWYPGLSEDSNMEDFQAYLHELGYGGCGPPCSGSPSPAPPCGLAASGACHTAVEWAMRDGIRDHPLWYPGLTSSSSFGEFQEHLARGGHGGCWPPSC